MKAKEKSILLMYPSMLSLKIVRAREGEEKLENLRETEKGKRIFTFDFSIAREFTDISRWF